jgi:hypothetical protein
MTHSLIVGCLLIFCCCCCHIICVVACSSFCHDNAAITCQSSFKMAETKGEGKTESKDQLPIVVVGGGLAGMLLPTKTCCSTALSIILIYPSFFLASPHHRIIGCSISNNRMYVCIVIGSTWFTNLIVGTTI